MRNQAQPRRLSPAALVVIFVFVLMLMIAAIWRLQLTVKLFIIASLIALAASHPVDWLERHRVPRIVAVIAMLALILAVVGALLAIFVPRVAREAVDLVDNLPGYWDDLRLRLQKLTERYPSIQQRIAEADLSREVTKRIEDFFATGISVAKGLAGGLAMTILLAITIAFMLINPRPLAAGIINLVPDPWTARARQIGGLLVERIRAWLRGLLILGSMVGLAVGIGLSLLGIPYAIVFGVLAGVLEIVPTVGPVLSAVPPILVALALEPVKALWVLLLFIVVQQVENTLLVPYVMKRQLQLHPVSTIFGLIAMTTLFRLFGAIIAVPTVACLKVLYDEVYYPWAHPTPPAAAEAVKAQPTSESSTEVQEHPAEQAPPDA